MKQDYLPVRGVRVRFSQASEGTPVVLIHGLGASVVTWSENMEALAQHHQVFALDLPGHGDSDKPEIDYSVPSGAHFLAAFLDALGLASAALIGNSVGGLLALRTALSYPQRVSHLVLVDAAGLGREVSWFLRLASLPLLGELLERPNVQSTDGLARSISSNPAAVDATVLEELKRVRNLKGAKRAVLKAIRSCIGLRGLKADHIELSRLSRIKIPVLVVWGEEDRVLPVVHAYRIAQHVKNVRVEVFPGCGHWPQMEDARRFNALVLDFLRIANLHNARAVG